MSNIILPRGPGWFGMVSPRAEEMPAFLKLVAQGWRTPKRKWEDLWRLRRGEFNHILGMRKFGPLRRYQRGILHPIGFWFEPAGGGGTEPDLTAISHTNSQVSPTIARSHIYYDSDGYIYEDIDSTGAPATISYTILTTQSDDANDHTDEWWPDQPETNEGLNWDIRYTSLSETGTATGRWKFYDGTAQRTENTWYLLDTVSLDAEPGATVNGSWGVNRQNGTAKSPSTGTATQAATIEIRETGTGSAVASHSVSLTVTGT